MFCPECGKTLEEGVVFCPNCGAKVGEALQAGSPISPPIKRPQGVVFIGAWNAFSGLLLAGVGALISGGAHLGVETLGSLGGGLPFGWRDEKYGGYEGSIVGIGILGYLILLLGMFSITAAYGIWTLARWGASLTKILCILSIILSFLLLPIGGRVTFGEIILTLVGAAIPVAIIFYLSKTDVKRLFQ